jgi:membrane protein DedA with SNARE-associated domain
MEHIIETFLDHLEDNIALFLHYQAYLAPVLLLALEECGIPLPVPGDLIIMYTGYQVAKGVVSYPLAFVSIMLAILLGSSVLYYLSAKYGERIVLTFGKYVHLDKKKLEKIERQFRKYGIIVIIVGRHIPGFRIPVTVFSGMSGIGYKKFILSTFISVILSTGINLSLGQKLGHKTVELLHTHEKFYLLGLIPLLITIIWGIFLVIKAKRKKTSGNDI